MAFTTSGGSDVRPWKDMLTSLGNFCSHGFTLVCATSTVMGPIQSILLGSKRRRVNLPCKGLDPPMVNSTSVFPKDVSPVLDAGISDSGGPCLGRVSKTGQADNR
jgi:hypothetical protein